MCLHKLKGNQMGEYADYYIELHENEVLNPKGLISFCDTDEPEYQKIYWVTKDGRKLDITEMGTSHIKFSIAKCKRDNWRMEAIPYLEQELKRRANDKV
jgi:hypothetical protein